MNIVDSGQEILSGNGTVAKLFYDKYLQRYPDVGRHFAQSDMTQQAIMLRMALAIVQEHYTHRHDAMEQYLRVIGVRHKLRGISPDLYADWRDCMLDALEEFHGDNWSNTLEEQWAAAINLAVDRIIEGYDAAASCSTH